MTNPTAIALGRLIRKELQQRFPWLTREQLIDYRETALLLMERRFGNCFSRQLISEVAQEQFDLLLESRKLNAN